MKISITYCLLLLSFLTSAQTYKLDYEPHGKIVKLYFDSLTIYTDTASLLSLYAKEGNVRDYDLRVMNLVRRQFNRSNKDTVAFSGNFIPFNDGVENKYQESWYVEWAIMHLTKNKKLKMFDKHRQRVKIIVTRRVGKRKNNFVKRSYINKATKEELLMEVLFIRIIDPAF